jgi:endoglucanase
MEAAIGRKLNIDHLFYPWTTVFPGWRQSWDLANGRIPMISWGSTNLSQVVNGSSDATIRDRANALAALGGPVMLRWFAEMDADHFAGHEIASPSQFVTAWRHMHDIFVSRGATNVQWVWCPNAYAFSTGEAQQFYPGDAYVDWICADGYNWAPARPNSQWVSFQNIFTSFYAWGAPKAQPLMIGETGVLENAPGDKAAWITAMGTTVKTTYPEIKALVYFDAYATANFGGWYDWRLDTSTSSFNAFKALAADPYFGGGGGPVSDTLAPTVPSGLRGSASASAVTLSWSPSTDNVGVVGYEVYRNGSLVATVPSTSFTDTAVSAGVTYSYAVGARDAAGNRSASCTPVQVTVPSATMQFSDGFESGSTSAWTTASGITLQSGGAHSGSWAASASAGGSKGSGTSASAFATKTLSGTYAELYARVWVKVTAQSSTVNLLRFQSSSGAAILTLFLDSAGELMLRNDARGTNVWSPTKPSRDAWHQVQVHVRVAGASGLTEVWYDGQLVSQLSTTQDLGTSPIGRVMLGDNVTGRSYQLLFDDVAVGQGQL